MPMNMSTACPCTKRSGTLSNGLSGILKLLEENLERDRALALVMVRGLATPT